MQRLIRKQPVFISLILIGGFSILIFYLSSISYKQLQSMSLLIGVVLGITISQIEIYCSRKKLLKKYIPTVFPYLIMWILLFLNIVFSNYVRLYLLGIFAAYFLTLALLFKVYEIKTKQRDITWNELLQDDS